MTQALAELRSILRPTLSSLLHQRSEDDDWVEFAALNKLIADAGPGLFSAYEGAYLANRILQVLFDLLAVEFLMAEEEDGEIETSLRHLYPELCRTCNDMVCSCPLGRAERQEKHLSGVVLLPAAKTPRTIREWQELLERIYGPTNSRIDARVILIRLAGKAHEAAAAALEGSVRPSKRDLADELARVFAWLCAYASKRRFDLSTLNQHVANELAEWRRRFADRLD